MRLVHTTKEMTSGYGGIGVTWDRTGFSLHFWKWGARFEREARS